tara:strand:- start:1887 stop:2069 length:183 start_codon:yes stop_codon:yes gene_type:complete
MNEKKVILDYLEWHFDNIAMQTLGTDREISDNIDQFLAEKETQEKDPEWFMETFWTENRA